jgi:hypothetical protein
LYMKTTLVIKFLEIHRCSTVMNMRHSVLACSENLLCMTVPELRVQIASSRAHPQLMVYQMIHWKDIEYISPSPSSEIHLNTPCELLDQQYSFKLHRSSTVMFACNCTRIISKLIELVFRHYKSRNSGGVVQMQRYKYQPDLLRR